MGAILKGLTWGGFVCGDTSVCDFHFKPIFSPNDINTPSTRADASSLRKYYLLCGQTVRQRKPKQPQIIKVKIMWNSSVPGTRTQQNKPDHKNNKNKNKKRKKKADRSSGQFDARISERLQEEHTCWTGKNNCCTDETHEKDEEDTDIRPAERKNKGKTRETSQKKCETSKQDNKTPSVITAAFAPPPLNSKKTDKAKNTTHL